MGREQFVGFMKYNVLSSAEVAEVLDVSKQMVNNYVKNGKLKYIKKTQNGYLFLRADVELLKMERDNEVNCNLVNINKQIIYDRYGITRKSIRFFKENIDQFGEIERVAIYFNEIDPILDNYYMVEEPVEKDNYIFRVTNPTFVLRDINGKEMWLSGCNCGYGGEGPNGSVSILKELGLKEELINHIYYNRVVKYVKYNQKWECNYRDSFIERKWDYPPYTLKNIHANIYYRKGNLILLQGREYGWDADPIMLIEKYRAFIPNPEEILILKSRDQACKYGYYLKNNAWTFSENIYQLIIKDKTGRELWLKTLLSEEEKLKEQNEVVDIIKYCGLTPKFPNEDDLGIVELVKKWLTSNGQQNPPKPIIIRD